MRYDITKCSRCHKDYVPQKNLEGEWIGICPDCGRKRKLSIDAVERLRER